MCKYFLSNFVHSNYDGIDNLEKLYKVCNVQSPGRCLSVKVTLFICVYAATYIVAHIYVTACTVMLNGMDALPGM